MTSSNLVTLDKAPVGKPLTVLRIHNQETASLALRLGVSEGERLVLACKIPGGPVVVRRGCVEIALGRELCRDIEIEPLAS